MGVHTFLKGICPKVNVIARLECELAYYDSAVHRFNHYTMRTPPIVNIECIYTSICVCIYIYIYIYIKNMCKKYLYIYIYMYSSASSSSPVGFLWLYLPIRLFNHHSWFSKWHQVSAQRGWMNVLEGWPTLFFVQV